MPQGDSTTKLPPRLSELDQRALALQGYEIGEVRGERIYSLRDITTARVALVIPNPIIYIVLDRCRKPSLDLFRMNDMGGIPPC